MAKYIVILFIITFLGCEINSKQIIKPEKYNFEEIKFNAVSKNLSYQNEVNSSDSEKIKKIIEYWYENKIKTNGFEGSLDIIVKDIIISKTNKKDHFNFSIEIIMEFLEKDTDLKIKKTYKIKAIEYGEIEGSFSINDQENLTINIMHQALNSISKKLTKLN